MEQFQGNICRAHRSQDYLLSREPAGYNRVTAFSATHTRHSNSKMCRNLGCNLIGCELCKNNPNRRCQSHFRDKYVDNTNRVFLARCMAPIMVRVVDAVTGDEFIDDALDRPHRFEGAQLQVALWPALLLAGFSTACLCPPSPRNALLRVTAISGSLAVWGKSILNQQSCIGSHHICRQL